MTNQLINLPHKNAPGLGVHWEIEPTGFIFRDSKGWKICTVSNDSPQAVASDIADVIRLARDAGYAQAMADVRKLFGVEK